MGYQLQSDQLAHKIVSSTRSRGARLVHQQLPHYVAGFAKMCIVHTSNFSTLKVHKIY